MYSLSLLQVLIDYFSHREKPGQYLKSLIEISDIKIDIATIDYNLPVRGHTPAVLAVTGSDRYFHR